MNSVSSAWFTGIPRTYFDHPQYIGLVCSRSNTQPSTQKNPNILLVILHVKTLLSQPGFISHCSFISGLITREFSTVIRSVVQTLVRRPSPVMGDG
jgi:hypothetical protein